MFPFSRAHSFSHPHQDPAEYLPELSGDVTELPCSQGHMPELPGSQGSWELSAQPNDTSLEQQYIPDSSQFRSSIHAVNLNEHQPRPGPRRSPGMTTPFKHQSHVPSQISTQANGSSRMTPASAFMVPSQRASPTEGQVGYPYPLMITAAAMPLAQTIITPSPTSTSSSTTVSPITPTHHDKVMSLADQYGAWNGSTCPVSPLHKRKQHQSGAGHSVSPVSSPRPPSAQGYNDPRLSLPTPPMASSPDPIMTFNPSEHQQHSFEGPHSSHPPQAFNTAGWPASPITTSKNNTRFDTSNEEFQSVGRQSLWERCHIGISQRQRPYHPNLFPPLEHDDDMNSFDDSNEMPPSYDEHPSTPPVAMHDGVRQIIFPSPEKSESKKTKRSLAGESCIKLFPPLLCEQCDKMFSGPYQKGNLKRHVKAFHSVKDVDDGGKKCRICEAVYKRADARRKHEWKKHKSPDCQPRKRRIEKRGGEKRIYMTPLEDQMPMHMPNYKQLVTG